MSTPKINFTEGFTGFFDGWESMRQAVGIYETNVQIYAENLLRLHTGKTDLNRRYKEVLACILLAGQGASVLDLGGGLGVTYFAIKKYLNAPPPVDKWTVVDLPVIVNYGQAQLADGRLQFTSPDQEPTFDIVLASHTMQYLADPYGTLRTLLAKRPRFVIFDELPLGDEVKYIVQKLPASLGGSELPCQILTHEKLAAEMRGYTRITDKILPDWCPIAGVKSHFRIYQLNDE